MKIEATAEVNANTDRKLENNAKPSYYATYKEAWHRNDQGKFTCCIEELLIFEGRDEASTASDDNCLTLRLFFIKRQLEHSLRGSKKGRNGSLKRRETSLLVTVP